MPVLCSRYRPRTHASLPYNRPSTSPSSSSRTCKTSPYRFLSLAQRALSIFFELPDARHMLVNNDDYATIGAFLGGDKSAFERVRRDLRHICARAYWHNGRILVGRARVVPETQLAQTLVTLPFRRNVADMVNDTEDNFIGVPEALVKMWHAYVLQHVYRREDTMKSAFPRSSNKRRTSFPLETANRDGFPSRDLSCIASRAETFSPGDVNLRSYRKSNFTTLPSTHISLPGIPPLPSNEESTIKAVPRNINAPPAVWIAGPGFQTLLEYERIAWDDDIRAIHFPSTSSLYPTSMAILHVILSVGTGSVMTESKAQLVKEGDLAAVVRAVEDDIEEREIRELADTRGPVDDEEFEECVEVATLLTEDR
ncbi:hypothetical protein CPB85DRAFT_1460363 [Mucidula mucida]|nr:hypothetical protein CPB85DRAFT_1460363 [Mucidula mucida]